MASKYVVLHHRTADGEHWDLMLECAGVLLTWQLAREPSSAADLPIPARRIADHRMGYLEYEGPISGGRGTVARVDAGAVDLESVSEGQVVFTLDGGRLPGRLALTRRDREGDVWTLAATSA